MNSNNRSFFRVEFPTFRAIWSGIVTGDWFCRPLTSSRRIFAAVSVSRIGRVAHLVAKAMLALAIVGLIVHSVLLVVWGRQLESKLAEIEARGEPLTPADLAPAPVPNSENAAVVYERVFSIMDEQGDPGYKRRDYINRETSAAERAALAPQVREDLRNNSEVFSLIREAVSRPKSVFPVEWEAGTEALFPHMVGLRNVARLLAVKAIYEAEDGNMDASIEYLTLGLRVSEALRAEPILVSHSVSNIIIRSSLSTLVTATQTRSLSLQQARLIYDELGKYAPEKGHLLAIEGERAMLNWIYEEIRRDYLWLWKVRQMYGLDYSSEPGLFRKSCYLVASYILRPALYRDHRLSLKMWDIQMQRVQLPHREAVKHTDELKALDRTMIVPFPAYMGSAFVRDITKAEIGLAQTAMALKAYKSMTGAYPESLDELMTRIDWPLPDDPFSGKPFIYQSTGEGFTIYSLGPDLKDDGGTPMDSSWDGDIVWTWKK